MRKLIILFLPLLAVGCFSSDEPRVYKKEKGRQHSLYCIHCYQGVHKLPFTWTPPASWQEGKASSMRIASFKTSFGNDCSISLFPQGDVATLEYINNWRQQLKLKMILPKELGQHSRKFSMTRLTGLFIDFTGEYTEMTSSASYSDYRILGVVAEAGEKVLFIKLVGPQAKVEKDYQEFVRFCATVAYLGEHRE